MKRYLSIRIVFEKRFPFEWKTPTGFFSACSIEALCFITIFEIALFALFIYIGMGRYSMAFISDIITNLKDIEDQYEEATKQQVTAGERRKMVGKFLDIVKFHTEASKYSLDINFFYQLNIPLSS